MITLWNTLFYKPLYNALIFLVDILPYHSMLLAVVILTIVVRFVIYPLSYKAVKTQIGMALMKDELERIKRQFKDKQEQAMKTMELYKQYGVNPFSSFLVMLIQFPIIIALYRVFINLSQKGLDENLLYPFVEKPEVINIASFGIHLGEKSIILALLVGLSQYAYLSLSEKLREKLKGEKINKVSSEKKESIEDTMQMVTRSMKYTMPLMVAIFSYMLNGALALYWFVSNLFMIGQEFYIYKKLRVK